MSAANKLNFPKSEPISLYGEACPFVMVGDEAFSLKPYLMRPFSRNSPTGEAEKIFNYILSRAKRIVGNAFGILAGRWRIFWKPIKVHPDTVDSIVLAACCLHNMLRVSFVEANIQAKDISNNSFQQVIPIRRNYTQEAFNVRENFKNFFVSAEGNSSCPWQWDTVRRGRLN
jgi:DDE superfamily endonuclease